jgi:hypothetical protein
MKTFRSSRGPFAEQPYYTTSDIEQICSDELRKCQLYPSAPSPVRIDRFIEKRFKVDPTYEELSAGLLGFTRFGAKGVEEIVIAKALDDDRSKLAERRLRTTLAHEGGHGLLHAHLFALGMQVGNLFGEGMDPKAPKILCREDDAPSVQTTKAKRYDGRWWEFQANQAMGALLLPRQLVEHAVGGMLIKTGTFGKQALDSRRRDEAIRTLADIFDVNPVVARIRIDALYPVENSGQLTM